MGFILSSNDNDKTVDFGFKNVPTTEKEKLVNEVFNDVAENYDLMNDLLSFGLHRIWKSRAVNYMNLSQGDIVLDVASGTGDMAELIKRKIGTKGTVFISDINTKMLNLGRDKLLDKGVNTVAINCDSEHLPFNSSSFDRVSIAFGLRNMTNKEVALKEINRVLKPNGKLVVLEFSQIHKSLSPIYDWYSFKILPRLGKSIAGTKLAYEYLAESIRKYPSPDEISNLMLRSGFLTARFQIMSFGVVSIHQAFAGKSIIGGKNE
ncbi:MAG: bifunctional demethylmenaquinone methyltransferase/2-methoxy-6-polyprenyl-1,4-benzoquinol methylase [Betaproteobacteria bacterium TMED156]|nr:MAG: bifunctional demethylmenaquinone methyltransferase/2-methoxy-6-polyprenyl-1,4-benzoquinol methylase [Betaproteobacteria bacterium TMED156]|tara:strand:+ start:1132 stop:1920 length:789 start_codon:yes stop_codon:yes gene_type:complete